MNQLTSVKGKRLTNTQSLDMMIQDFTDIPVIPPLRIKLEPTGIVDKHWLENCHANMGDHIEVIKMRPGGDIVRGLVGDDPASYLEDLNDDPASYLEDLNKEE